MKPLNAAIFAALSLTLCLPSAALATQPCPDAVQTKAALDAFAQRLLVNKDPRGAYETLAAANFVQKNPPFGANLASTIKQWETMTSLPASRFELTSLTLAGDLATLRFKGKLGPGPGAEVAQYDRLVCGKIVEEWAEFRIVPETGK